MLPSEKQDEVFIKNQKAIEYDYPFKRNKFFWSFFVVFPIIDIALKFFSGSIDSFIPFYHTFNPTIPQFFIENFLKSKENISFIENNVIKLEKLNISIVFGFLCIVLCLFYLYKKEKEPLKPIKGYKYKKGNSFIGIYDQNNPDITKEILIDRSKEIDCLYSYINKIYNNEIENQPIFIVGKSGCGKSTIIDMLLSTKSESDIKVINCTNNYQDLKYFIETKFKDIQKYEPYGKVLLIFDQSERLFSSQLVISKNDSEDYFSSLVKKLNKKNIVKIFILRNEYLSDLINKINFPVNEQIRDKKYGLLKYYGKRLDSDTKNYKEDFSPYIFFCYKINQEKEKNRINSLFGMRFNVNKNWENIFNQFKNCSLIEQQIFFSMMEIDTLGVISNQNLLEGDIELVKKKLLKRYYERQLCCTKDYKKAIRILYLFSIARIHNYEFSKENISIALYLVDPKYERLDDCIQSLCDLNLIKQIEKNNENYYEVVHDYIAETFISYANSELKIEIKTILDNYCANYKREEYTKRICDTLKEKTEPKKSASFLFWVTFIILLSYPIVGLIFFNIKYTIIIAFPISLSLYYGYSLYNNILRFHPCPVIKETIPFIMAIMVILSVYLYKYWVIILGFTNFVIGGCFAILYFYKEFPEITRSFYKGFGTRIMAMSGVIICVAFFVRQNTLIEILLMMAILIYGYRAHLNDIYYYYCLGLLHFKE